MGSSEIYIVKRDGQHVPFSIDKIKNAIRKAFIAVGGFATEDDLTSVLSHLRLTNGMSVEEIQNQVETGLMAEKYFKVAKEFMLYRQRHAEDRDTRDKLNFLIDYCNSANPATGSKFDANANVENKNIATLMGELPKQGFIRMNRRILCDRLKDMYGKELADKYIKLLKSHFIYKNDETSLANYCASITMYPWLLGGTISIGGNSTRPTNLKSFCGGFVNLVFIVSSMLSGACATPEFLMYLNYFIGQEYGEDYYKRADEVVDLSTKKRTIDKVITDCFEQIVYSINQPTGARNFQAVFWNVAYYDKYYFESLFGEFRFPDGSKPDWNGLSWLQKRFMKWFNAERLKTPLTFPVETMALLTDGDEVRDKEWGDFTAEMYAEGHSFFTYMSDNLKLLPSAQRNSGQRFQLHPRCRRSVHGFQVRAHHQSQPLHTVCSEERNGLYLLPRGCHRPCAQGTARLQRESQGTSVQGYAPALRCRLHQYRKTVSHHRYQRYGRGCGIPRT